MRGKWLLVIGTLVVLAGGAGGIFWLRQQNRPASAKATSAPSANPFSGPVATLPGRIEAIEVVEVPVPFPGKLESLPVDVGAQVAEGDLLAVIRSSSLETQRDALNNELYRIRSRVSTLESNLIAARLEASRAREAAEGARASMEEAQKALSRQELLFSKGATAKQALDRVQIAYDRTSQVYEAQQKVVKLADDRVSMLSKELDDQQQAANEKTREYEDAIAQVGTGDVKSPVDGLVIARNGKIGDDATIETESLYQIAVNLMQLRVIIDAPPPLLERVRTGQDVIIQVAELADGIPSTVTEVREGQVVIDFTSPNPIVKPGMTVHVVIKLT